jgi:hypothetical protein
MEPSPSYSPLKESSKSDSGQSKAADALTNISALIPADATALYLAGLNIVENKALDLWIVTIVALLFAMFIRFVVKASNMVKVVTFISFVVWVYGIGGGVFQLYDIDFGNVGGFVILAYSAIITYFVGKPKK